MSRSADLFYDATTAQSQGQRDAQEDAVVADFPVGAGMGFVVLGDGMGGHAAGDVASKIVVTEVFSELKLRSGDPTGLETDIPGILREALISANDCVRFHAEGHPETEGMGSTLIAPVLMGNRLYWISVGDSPLYLYRDQALIRLNQEHSMSAQIDYMHESGLIGAEEAENHPHRNCLTSVLMGEEIARIDCPADPCELRAGDIVIAASDGLLYLTDEEIEQVIESVPDGSSGEICATLMRNLENLNDPEQDNITLCVVRVIDDPAFAATGRVNSAPPLPLRPKRGNATTTFVVRKAGGDNFVTYNVSMEKSA